MLRDADNVMLNGKYHSNKNISVKNRRKIEVFKKSHLVSACHICTVILIQSKLRCIFMPKCRNSVIYEG